MGAEGRTVAHLPRRTDRLRSLEDADERGDGDPANNLRDLGFHPFVPHLCVYWHEITPREHESWMEFDFAWLVKCDAVFRMTGHSPGSDREVEFARTKGIPVFFNIGDLLLWARK